MKKYILGAAFLLAVLITPLASAQAAGLTQEQANVLILVVGASPTTPASAFVNLITAFSGVTDQQALSLINVVRASPTTPSSAFVPLLTSFTGSSPDTLQINTTTNTALPHISSIQSKAANTGTVYVGEYPTISGTGLGGIVTVTIGGKQVIAASDVGKDTSTTFLVPTLPAGNTTVTVTNSSGKISNTYTVLVVVPTTSAVATPTITEIGSKGQSAGFVVIGQTAYVNGSNFDGNSYISIGNVPGSANYMRTINPTSYTNTLLTFTVPSDMSAGTWPVYIVKRSSVSSPASNPSTLTFVSAPTASSGFDTASGTLSLSSSSCTIRNGYSDCTVSASWSTTGVSSVTLMNDKGAAIDAHSPNVSAGYSAIAVAVANGGTTFTLHNTATGAIISSRFATASCESGTSWNSTTLRCANTPAPSLSSFVPTAITAGSNTSIVIYGSGFKPGATIIFSGTSSGESPAATYVSGDGTQMNIGSYVFGYAGTWTFRVKNPDGQMSGGSGPFTITAPTIAPTVQSFSLPSTVNVNDTFTATWTGSSNAASYQFNATGINNGNFSPLTTSSSWSGTAASLGFSAGTTYVMGIRACTSDGTCGNPSYRTIAVNAPVTATAPAAPVLTVQSFTLSATTVGLNDSFSASWTGSSDAASYQFNANGINGGAFSPLTSASSWIGTAASLGFSAGTSYAIGIRACNSSGTCGTPSYATIAVTGTPATISIGVTGTTLYWSASPNATSCSFRVNGAPWGNLSPLTGTSPLVGIGLTVGTSYTIQAFCLNASGQQGPTATLVYTPTVAVTSTERQTASAIDAFNSAANASVSGTTSGFHYSWSRNVGIGSMYAFDVTALQTALTREGVYTTDVTGGFYNQTSAAVKAFQQKYGIETTGFVGSQTRSKLNALYSN